jgi:hypothetical protein
MKQPWQLRPTLYTLKSLDRITYFRPRLCEVCKPHTELDPPRLIEPKPIPPCQIAYDMHELA